METRLQTVSEDSKVPKFSIIIPIYNVEKFLQDCLNSIQSQTLKDFEVICINDGSTDNSLEILQDYASKDSRFIIISQENQGPGIARNTGINLAKGEYIVFVDPDDFIDINSLQILYENFQKSGVKVIQFDFQCCRENGKFDRYRIFKKQLKNIYHYKIKDNEIFSWHNIPKKDLQDMWMAVWNKAYKTDFIKSNNIKMAPSKIGEDHLFSISANLLADEILYLNKPLYHYRTRLGSMVNKPSNDNFCIFENIELVKKFLIEHNLLEEYKTSFADYVSNVLSWHYTNIPAESTEVYLDKCKTLLSSKDYALFLKKTKAPLTLMQRVFSVRNQKINGVKVKYLTILGISFPIKK